MIAIIARCTVIGSKIGCMEGIVTPKVEIGNNQTAIQYSVYVCSELMELITEVPKVVLFMDTAQVIEGGGRDSPSDQKTP